MFPSVLNNIGAVPHTNRLIYLLHNNEDMYVHKIMKMS